MQQNKPEHIVYQAIRNALVSGELKPGMRLPAERKLAEQYGVSRGYVREALNMLEIYGIIRTMPQSGSYIVGLDINALDGLLTNLLQLSAQDFAALAEMRCILEVNAARFCAERYTESDMALIDEAMNDYIRIANEDTNDARQDADFRLHRCIATGAHNGTLQMMLNLITPDITTIYQQQRVCDQQTSGELIAEHAAIVKAIKERDSEKAAALMKEHLSGVAEYAASIRNAQSN